MRKLLTLVGTLALVASLTPAVSALDLTGGDTETFIVVLSDPPLATYEGGIAGLAPTAPYVTGADRLDASTPAAVAYLAYLAAQQDAAVTAIQVALARPVEVGLRYNAVANGFTAELTSAEAATVAGLPGIARVEPDVMLELHTDAGPGWIGAPALWDGSQTGGVDGTRGEGVVAGIIDTGVNPQHPSFAEVGPVDGHVHANPRGTYYGLCDPLTGAPFCNDKLIGMWDFTAGGQPQDDNGHGSHVASTVAGNVLDMSLEAPTISIDRRISGVAPHANIISYKACLAVGCPQSGTLGAINQATLDQTDVVNFSIGGGPSNPWTSLLATAFLNARAAGVFVATSAGNSGPGPGTVGNPANAPWVFTIGASTHDRNFPNLLSDLERGGEPGPADLVGKGLTGGYGPARVVYAGDYGNALCSDGTAEAPLNPFAPGTFDGEIVVCDRGTYARVDKARHVHEAGAGGFVLANDEASGDSLSADPYALPGVHVTYTDGVELKAWIADGGGPDHEGTAVITGMTADESPDNGDVMASFSSRGPNAPATTVLKPDITAPGVDILAAWEGLTSPTDPETYNSISGTSMSSPHAAGAGALLRALRPDWSPDEVRSAVMTTAFTEPPGTGGETHPVVKEDGETPADPFDHGAGRIDLRQAARAGLVLDESPDRYQAADPGAGGDPRTLNLPSMADPACQGTCSWTRELRSAAAATTTWTATADATPGTTVSVEPSSFTLAPGEAVTVTVTADVSGSTGGGWQFGAVHLTPDGGVLPATRLPLAVGVEGGGAEVEHLTLHFRGNAGDEWGCTGDGRADILECGGPFLVPDGELSDAPAARWGPVTSGVDGTAAQNIYDPNWTWVLDGETTVGGPMTVEWWAGCPACGVFGEDWTIRLWADGELAHAEQVTATPPAVLPARLEASVTLPEITAQETLTLHVDPFYVDTQQGTIVYYDSTEACPGGSEAGCDSVVHMPLPVAASADLAVTGIRAERIPASERESPGVSTRVVATVANLGDADAAATHTEFWVRGADRDDLLGLVATPPVAAGDQVEVTVGWDLRGLNGDYTVTVTTDALGAVADADPTNDAGRLLAEVRGNRVRSATFEPGAG